MTQDQLDQIWKDHEAKKLRPGQEECDSAHDGTDTIKKGDEAWDRLPGQKIWRKRESLPIAPPKKTVL